MTKDPEKRKANNARYYAKKTGQQTSTESQEDEAGGFWTN